MCRRICRRRSPRRDRRESVHRRCCESVPGLTWDRRRSLTLLDVAQLNTGAELSNRWPHDWTPNGVKVWRRFTPTSTHAPRFPEGPSLASGRSARHTLSKCKHRWLGGSTGGLEGHRAVRWEVTSSMHGVGTPLACLSRYMRLLCQLRFSLRSRASTAVRGTTTRRPMRTDPTSPRRMAS